MMVYPPAGRFYSKDCMGNGQLFAYPELQLVERH